jgi:uncharacterized membrane protein YoaK (UPF0700 family)
MIANPFARHKRTSHDLKLASLLSLTAGSVNAASFFAFSVLTTNITGHATNIGTHLVAQSWWEASMAFLWVFSFFFGAFVCSLIMEVVGRYYPRFSHTIPLVMEMVILLLVSHYGYIFFYEMHDDHTIPVLGGSLLFAAGLQNAMVSKLSGAVIRTTHLTGMMTDIGINLAHSLLPFSRKKEPKLGTKLLLHGIIVLSFIVGGIIGAYLFSRYLYYAYYFPLTILFIALVYDLTYYRQYLLETEKRVALEKKKQEQKKQDQEKDIIAESTARKRGVADLPIERIMK